MKVIKTLQRTPRFLVEQVEFDGRPAVRKRAASQKMIYNLQQELFAYQLYDRMTKLENCPFTIAEVLDYDTDFIVLSFLDGVTMREANRDQKNHADNDELLVNMFAFCDNRIKIVDTKGALDHDQATLNKMIKRAEAKRERIANIPETGIDIDVAKLNRAVDVFIKHLPDLPICFANADLTESHVMLTDGKPAIFDFENARIQGHRFSDVINVVTKIWFIQGDKDRALTIYRRFWEQCGDAETDHLSIIKTLIMQRCIGFIDELITPPNEFHNTSLSLDQNFADNITAVYDWGDSLV